MNPENIHVFLGPTLPQAKARTMAAAMYHGPAAMGDITQIVTKGAEAIILVDGIFERGPSVWHKEILWALSRGVAVIGCSSMGALRAAELDCYGMFGCGQVYEAYASGDVTDDDEVAVTHAPAELDWQPLTDAMIDIRHRIKRAEVNGLLTSDQANAVVTLAKNTFFKERSLKSAVAETVRDNSLSHTILAWIFSNTSSLKQQDCEALLLNMQSCIQQAHMRARHAPAFEPTVYLRRLEKFGFNSEAQR
jgi:hypothetical protein